MGRPWTASNTGVKAEFFPGERNFPEFGQCVHKVARDATDPDRLYLQNHGGVYRSDDGGASWQDIAPGLPTEFGFAMVAHPRRANTAYNFPIAGAEARWPVDGKARVYRTTDGGATWEPLGEGSLPDELLRRRHARRDVRRRPRAAPASTSAAATVASGPRPDDRRDLAGDPQGPART